MCHGPVMNNDKKYFEAHTGSSSSLNKTWVAKISKLFEGLLQAVHDATAQIIDIKVF